jgi:hypothetical protein
MAVGTRFHKDADAMPLGNRIVNIVLTWMSNIRVPREKQITDSQCGFRAFRADVFKDIRTSESKFGFITETLVKAYKLGLTIEERPVKCIYHNGGRSRNSTMNRVSQGILLIFRVIRWRLWEKFGV